MILPSWQYCHALNWDPVVKPLGVLIDNRLLVCCLVVTRGYFSHDRSPAYSVSIYILYTLSTADVQKISVYGRVATRGFATMQVALSKVIA